MRFGSYQKLLCQFLFAGDTEELNRRWYEANTGQVLTDVQQEVRHRRKPQERKRRLPIAGGSFCELVRASRIAQRD